MGGRFGEMSTLMNYMFQSYNFRNKAKLKPYYSLISNIATEELGHVELIAAAVNGCTYGQEPQGDMTDGGRVDGRSCSTRRCSRSRSCSAAARCPPTRAGTPGTGPTSSTRAT